MSEHPTPRELRRFVAGRLPRARLCGVLRHLTRCEDCVREIDPDLAFDPEEVDESVPVEVGPEYDEPVERAITGALRRADLLARESAKAAPVVEAVREGAKSFPVLSERDSHRLRGLPLVELLLELSRSARHSRPDRMIEFAELALLALRPLEPQRYGAALLADTRARALGELANAWRVG